MNAKKLVLTTALFAALIGAGAASASEPDYDGYIKPQFVSVHGQSAAVNSVVFGELPGNLGAY